MAGRAVAKRSQERTRARSQRLPAGTVRGCPQTPQAKARQGATGMRKLWEWIKGLFGRKGKTTRPSPLQELNVS